MSVPTRTPPRVVEVERPVRGSMFEDGLPEWTGAALASVQAVALSVLVVVLPAVAASLTSSIDPTDQSGWLAAATVGLRIWLFAHGVPLVTSSATLTLVPLGLTAVALYAQYASIRRTGVAGRPGLVAGTLAYVALTALVATIAGDSSRLPVALAGGLVIGALGTGLGLARRPTSTSWRRMSDGVHDRLPSSVALGARAGALAVAVLVLGSSLLVGLWVVAGRATIGDVVRELPLDAVGGVVFALAQLAYLPNLVVWALAWLAGPGFVVGAGTTFTAGSVVAGPMPAFPLLGALPSSAVGGRVALLAPLVVVLIGGLAGLFVHRRSQETGWWYVPAAVGSLVGVAAVAVGVLVAASAGAAGPGRLAVVGGTWWVVGPVVAGLLGGGALVVALPASPLFRAQVRLWWADRPHRAVGEDTELQDAVDDVPAGQGPLRRFGQSAVRGLRRRMERAD
ncbi:MAG: hypothetical protein KJ548_01950 [Actinobacteria bacterium]|nr:hypothetical protein [Actinomycetota bacterium]MCG2797118.1 DUF6350 family protein [Cellulomonas sp.]